ncbi:DUF5825 family protein [Streptomyces beihaiensis]|uniref:DUF5825 family protein n=1 Tax=Streptomyces beihaiensis TaxID=2984495 RepID=A0ABT3TRM7_9ACTN|nr:DUF5825 family protein [Streptomyces beihaiensis]MCX3059657.1 DUF5825 family protein [Streptomyces beihaiensis]
MSLLPATVAHRVTAGTVRVTEKLHLYGDGADVTRGVHFLRECQSLGLRTQWEQAGGTGCRAAGRHPCGSRRLTYDLGLLSHLPPPVRQAGEAAELTELLRDWRERHSYGMLYHRRGPGFVAVMDRREHPAPARLLLDHPGLLAAFRALREPAPLDGLDARLREAARLLAEDRLVLAVDGWAVALPPRIRRWPVPGTAI